MINLQAIGAVGDGVTDNTAVIQGACDAAPTGETLYLPQGNYKVTSTIRFAHKGLRLLGDGQGHHGPYSGGSRLFGTIDGALVWCDYPGSAAGLSDVALYNLHPAGIGAQVGGVNLSIDRVLVSAFRGIDVQANTFTIGIRNVTVRCSHHAAAGSVGIQTASHTSIQSADVVGFDHGIRVTGVGVGIRDLRVEVNRVGLCVGMNAAGQVWAAQSISVEAVSLEANDVGIEIHHLNGSRFSAIRIQGTTNAPSGQSKIGISVKNTADTSFDSVNVTQGHNVAAVRVFGGRHSWLNANISNTIGPAWDAPPIVRHVEFN